MEGGRGGTFSLSVEVDEETLILGIFALSELREEERFRRLSSFSLASAIVTFGESAPGLGSVRVIFPLSRLVAAD